MQDKILKAFRDYYEIYFKHPELVIVHPETFYDIKNAVFGGNIYNVSRTFYVSGAVVKEDPYMEVGKMVMTDKKSIDTTWMTEYGIEENKPTCDSWMLVDLT